MTTDELLDDLAERLELAVLGLNDQRSKAERNGYDGVVDRLTGKIQGVKLALDYLRSYR